MGAYYCLETRYYHNSPMSTGFTSVQSTFLLMYPDFECSCMDDAHSVFARERIDMMRD